MASTGESVVRFGVGRRTASTKGQRMYAWVRTAHKAMRGRNDVEARHRRAPTSFRPRQQLIFQSHHVDERLDAVEICELHPAMPDAAEQCSVAHRLLNDARQAVRRAD